MAILTPQPVPVSGGLTPAPGPAAAGGDEAPVGNQRILYVTVAGAAVGTRTVTVATPGTVRGLAVADVSATLSAGDVWVLPLIRAFRNPSTRRAAVTYDDATDVSIAVLEPEG